VAEADITTTNVSLWPRTDNEGKTILGYTAGSTEFRVPAKLSDELAAECARVAVLAHETLGLRDLSRSDLIIDDEGVVWFLEVNVAPGMAETSTVPLSVTAAGLDLGGLFAGLVHRAVHRAAHRSG